MADSLRRAVLFGGTCLFALNATSGMAQEVAPAVAPSAAANASSDSAAASLGDIIVTARRKSESLQSVPVTVSAFTSESIRTQGITNANDLMKVAPGIFTAGASSPFNTLYSIRGQSKPVAGNSPSGVVTYFAEVPQPTRASGTQQFDLANIQVLKGPQGTLFGRNVLGGAILLEPTAPSLDRVEGYLQATVGNYDAHQLEGALNLPIVQDKLAIRLAGNYAKRDGFVRNLGGNGKREANLDSKGIRLSVLAEPFEGLKNTTILDYSHDANDGPGVIMTGLNPSLFPFFPAPIVDFLKDQFALQQARGVRVTDTGALVPRETIKRWGVVNRTEYQFTDTFSVLNIFGYRNQEYLSRSTPDGLPAIPNFPVPGATFDLLHADNAYGVEQLSNELQLRLKMFDGNVNLLVGGFYLHDRPVGQNRDGLTIFGAPSISYNFLTNTSKAFFTNASINLSSMLEGLSVDLGFRYTWDKQTNCGASGATGVSDPTLRYSDCLNNSAKVVSPARSSAKSSAPTWTIGVNYQATPDAFFYVVSRRGYRAGGLNSPKLGVGLAQYQGFGPETVTDFEGGAKLKWRAGDARGVFNVSVFTQTNNKVQTPITGLTTTQTPGVCLGNPPSPPWIDGDCDLTNDPANTLLVFNVGKTRTQGVELETSVNLFSQLELSLSGSFMKHKILEVGTPPIGAAVADPRQVFFQYAPKKGVNIGAVYTPNFIPESVGELSLGARYSWSDDVPAAAVTLPAHHNLDLRADLRNIGGRPVDIAFFVKNVTKETYLSATSLNVGTLPWFSGFYSDPRTFGVELRYRFGNR
ncbi:TonB-dependent receptor [Sphingobium sp. Sx8-8]|uniref:TonB-dependent receptor n=1 Tax=Sphingobium sp. Sx8-8 TaxID=2933617 RepID=UPI001F567243|nr:TonB-dependent receptor [Sphingobium sp. Sx8-8]